MLLMPHHSHETPDKLILYLLLRGYVDKLLGSTVKCTLLNLVGKKNTRVTKILIHWFIQTVVYSMKHYEDHVNTRICLYENLKSNSSMIQSWLRK